MSQNPVPRVVLDTNVVLDWLLFGDPGGNAVGRAILAGSLEWIATREMRAEYFDVLGRPALAGWAPDPAAHHAAWNAHCRPATATVPRVTPPIVCTDPDDQMFVDLALAERVTWLFSRDKALLQLAKQMRSHGIVVTTPCDWMVRQLPGPTA